MADSGDININCLPLSFSFFEQHKSTTKKPNIKKKLTKNILNTQKKSK